MQSPGAGGLGLQVGAPAGGTVVAHDGRGVAGFVGAQLVDLAGVDLPGAAGEDVDDDVDDLGAVDAFYCGEGVQEVVAEGPFGEGQVGFLLRGRAAGPGEVDLEAQLVVGVSEAARVGVEDGQRVEASVGVSGEPVCAFEGLAQLGALPGGGLLECVDGGAGAPELVEEVVAFGLERVWALRLLAGARLVRGDLLGRGRFRFRREVRCGWGLGCCTTHPYGLQTEHVTALVHALAAATLERRVTLNDRDHHRDTSAAWRVAINLAATLPRGSRPGAIRARLAAEHAIGDLAEPAGAYLAAGYIAYALALRDVLRTTPDGTTAYQTLITPALAAGIPTHPDDRLAQG